MSGYSEKPLIQKLGYAPTETVAIFGAPDWFQLELNQADAAPIQELPAVWAHGFFHSKAEIETWLQTHDLSQIEKGLWVSWPKKSSGIKTDLAEQTFRDLILPTGWVDVKVAAIDDTWSGLKFLRRKTS